MRFDKGATFNKSLWLAVGAADGREGRALHNQPKQPGGPSGALSGAEKEHRASLSFFFALTFIAVLSRACLGNTHRFFLHAKRRNAKRFV